MSDNTSTAPPEKRNWLNRTVLSIGLASLFGDISYEMANAVLPVLVSFLGAGPALLGIIEGAADLFSSGAKLVSGMLGDRLRPRKYWGGAMYLLTGLATTAFGFISSPLWLVVAKSVGWLGKGWRSPLKDALLADDTDKRDYGKAYGFERAGDTIGAVLGPFLAVGIVMLATRLLRGHVPDHLLSLQAVRHVFWFSLIPATIAGLFLALGAREHYLINHARRLAPWDAWQDLPLVFRRWLIAVGVFGAGDFSKTLLILWAIGKSTLLSPDGFSVLPLLLYAGYNVVGAGFAYLTGALSDHLGRKWLLVGGYAAGVGAAAILALSPPNLPAMITVFFLSGVLVGTEEALEKATGADLLSAAQRTMGFGVLATVNGIGDFISSVGVGLLWAALGAPAAFGFAALLALIGTILLAFLSPPRAEHETA
ncbi:MAG TPA: MFS transporter [Armatimonadota bacterium]|jgi:MFS family permease